ncbi:MAG: phosphohydrolase [Sphingobacteriales bacterium SCN 48-20]|uniref:HD domain-containing protein n=1 Tax=Terrimonas ferruginea TaxID=249 RepID=UPI00086E3798|nr:HD domain-containing protein [Terrimonas ferruginea]MBN8781546.1 HD domain-containing protein [Terrimonas ferruginea]ODT94879.1 MAG: phosphohydrolase [Sphingobacteriales bacterium SCN 48-20]OJW44709.1 MAG: phosphohydrolase [Sphingobacteriales bacterium 48-107]
MNAVRKIINDPVYGFITIDHPLILQIISHPYYQRLRNIHQMAFAHIVYPGAVHTRLHHSLGAYHLMCTALSELKSKQIPITQDEELGAKIAILLHDIGHGPFSHALENELIPGAHHEKISLCIMEALNDEFNGQLSTAIAIFTNKHPKPFLHQLISGQLDVDRMDYLNRDSFFTGVAEGVIGYDRIIKMLAVKDGNLLVEEKAVYSIEKFLLARRLMYWQVYLHKTVIAAEMMVVKIIHRAKELIARGKEVNAASMMFDNMLKKPDEYRNIKAVLPAFCQLDDHDIMATIKNWIHHPDKILSLLCRSLIDRRLYKVKLQAEPIPGQTLEQARAAIMEKFGVSPEEAHYLVFTGVASNTTYNLTDERISILFKDGTIKDISEVDNALIQHNLSSKVKKHYICCMRYA